VRVLASGPQLGGPNGIRLDRGSLSWVTFFGHEVKRLTRNGQLLTEATLPVEDVSSLGLPPGTLFLDGYARDEGDLLVSSWVSGKVFRIGRSGTDLATIAYGLVSDICRQISDGDTLTASTRTLRRRAIISLTTE
jgi:hypothetical protein